MEQLERARLQALESEAERQNGLIVIIAVRDFRLIPADIRQSRLCKDFEAYTLKPNMRRDPGFQQDVIDISRYIADRVRVFERLNHPLLQNCENFRLPAEHEVLQWIREIAAPVTPLPNRVI